jgi:hypothetical protein
MNSDTYSFAKASAPQGADLYTPYQSKDWQYINDINSGVYSPSNTLIQLDLSSIYNSNGFCAADDLFVVLPVVMQAAWLASNGTGVAPVAGHSSLCCLKTNFQHLIHQVEVVANGKVVNDTQPFINMYQHFKLASQMSVNDVRQFGPSLGFGPDGLDNEKSVRFTTEANTGLAGGVLTSVQGVGLCNNAIYRGAALVGNDYQPVAGPQNTQTVNRPLLQRATRLVDTTSTAYNTGGGATQSIYGSFTPGANTHGAIMTATQLSNENKPYYSVASDGFTMLWQDLAVIPLKYLCDCLDKMGIVRKLDLVIRLYANTGTQLLSVANAGTANTYQQVLSNTFVNTVPLTVNYMGATTAAADGGIPTTATRLAVGLYIGKAPGAQFAGSVSGQFLFPQVTHFMPAVRCYYSLIKLDPAKAAQYIEENRAKQCVFENVLFNQYNTIPAGGTFSQLVQSGIKNPLGILMIPLISGTTVVANTSTAGGAVTLGSIAGGEQWQSPYDTCPSTFAPISLVNLQVALGGVNMLQSSLYYTFENFIEQVALAESLTSTDLGIGTGLISQSWWEMNRCYYVDLARGRQADRENMRNLTISFLNNSLVPVTLMVFTVYLDKITLDVETGAVRK